MDEEYLNIPIDLSVSQKVADEHQKLKDTVEANKSTYSRLQTKLKEIIVAATTPKKAPDQIEKVDASLKSIENIDESNSEGNAVISINEDELSPPSNEPGVDINKFLECVACNELDVSDDFIKQLYDINSELDELRNTNRTITQRLKDLDDYITFIQAQINNILQYFKRDNILLHNFELPPKHFTSLQYSKYCADLLNKHVPNLPVEVKWEHISTAHWLPTKARKSDVILVRFCNRNVRDAIFNAKDTLSKPLSISEHLTETNHVILNKAKELFGVMNVYTDRCYMYVRIGPKSHRVTSLTEVHKLYVNYCESLGMNDNVPLLDFYRKPVSSGKPTYSSVVSNSMQKKNTSPRRPYSVYNR